MTIKNQKVFIYNDGWIFPKFSQNHKLIEYVLGGEDGTCWNCVSHAPKDSKRYPKVKRLGKVLTLSRVVYEHYNKKKIAEGLFILHKCDNRLCINPEHLYEGDASQNMKDMWSRNRDIRPDPRLSNAKLTQIDRREINDLLKNRSFTQKRIGELYGVCTSTIEGIQKRRKREEGEL